MIREKREKYIKNNQMLRVLGENHLLYCFCFKNNHFFNNYSNINKSKDSDNYYLFERQKRFYKKKNLMLLYK